jgi:hypothetical protein
MAKYRYRLPSQPVYIEISLPINRAPERKKHARTEKTTVLSTLATPEREQYHYRRASPDAIARQIQRRKLVMIDHQKILSVIGASALAKPIRVLLAVYELADFSGAVSSLPILAEADFMEPVKVLANSYQSSVFADVHDEEKKHGDLHARYCALALSPVSTR